MRYVFVIGSLAVIGSSLVPYTLVSALFGILLCWCLCLCVAKTCLLNFSRMQWAVILLGLALCWLRGGWWVNDGLQHRLPLALNGVVCEALFSVEEVLAYEPGQYQSLRVDMQRLDDCGATMVRTVRLGLYRSRTVLQVGDVVSARIRLRTPYAMLNGLFFDYEAWALGKGLDASGYIQQLVGIRHPDGKQGAEETTAGIRERLSYDVTAGHEPQVIRWIRGLLLGDQAAFTDEQWRLAKLTGTVHLLVVSGLHMGVLLLFVSLVVGFFLRCFGLLFGSLSRPGSSWIITLLPGGNGHLPVGWQQGLILLMSATLSLLFVWLAGSGIALQRAWLMALAALIVWRLGIRLSPVTGLTVVALLVLLISPLIYTSAGFWLSFAAVGVLLTLMRGRSLGQLAVMLVPQWLVFIGLVPFLLLVNAPVMLVSLLANTLAIPLMTLVMLPLTLLSAAFGAGAWSDLLVWLDHWWWQGLELLVSLQWPSLDYLGWPLWFGWLIALVLVARQATSLLALAVQGMAMLLMLALGFNWIAVAVQQRISVLDVGQGLAVVAGDHNASLVYDLGVGKRDGFAVSDRVVIPVLQSRGLAPPSVLVVGHADSDHAGGLQHWLLFYQHEIRRGQQQVFIGEKVSAYRKHLNGAMYDLLVAHAQRCHESDLWNLLGAGSIRYRFLSSGRQAPDFVSYVANNRSCVMQVESGGKRILVPGDILAAEEQRLVSKYGAELASDWLVAAHHGSRSSSSARWMEVVDPQAVVFSAGFANRYHHPHDDVVERMSERDVYLTAKEGAVTLFADGKIASAGAGWQPVWRQRR